MDGAEDAEAADEGEEAHTEGSLVGRVTSSVPLWRRRRSPTPSPIGSPDGDVMPYSPPSPMPYTPPSPSPIEPVMRQDGCGRVYFSPIDLSGETCRPSPKQGACPVPPASSTSQAAAAKDAAPIGKHTRFVLPHPTLPPPPPPIPVSGIYDFLVRAPPDAIADATPVELMPPLPGTPSKAAPKPKKRKLLQTPKLMPRPPWKPPQPEHPPEDWHYSDANA